MNELLLCLRRVNKHGTFKRTEKTIARLKRKPLTVTKKNFYRDNENGTGRKVLCDFEVIDLMPLTYHNQSQQTPSKWFEFQTTMHRGVSFVAFQWWMLRSAIIDGWIEKVVLSHLSIEVLQTHAQKK